MSKMASRVASSVDGSTYERSHVESESAVSFVNVVKPKQRAKSFCTAEVSSVSGSTTGNSMAGNPMLRRRSTLKGLVHGITGMFRMRKLTVSSIKPTIKLENTYRMSPDTDNNIAASKIEQVAEEILRNEIGNKEYNSFKAGDMACSISAMIKNKVKEMDFPRYRLICQVIITQVHDQGIEAASRCLWDANYDNFTTVSYRNESIAAVAMLYGVYLE